VRWVLLFAGLALVAALLLGAISWRLWTKVRRLAREVSRASERLAAVQAELSTAADDLRPGA
jgi:uncharacterized membrane-anchored protein YhcB (DUF1043 family)